MLILNIFSNCRDQKVSHSSIGLTVVRHNSGELFHLQAAGHFSLQKHCRFQLISSASDRLEIVSSFEFHLPGELLSANRLD